METIKNIDGKKFIFKTFAGSKKTATEQADRLRKTGNDVRILGPIKREATQYHGSGNVYEIWVHKRAGGTPHKIKRINKKRGDKAAKSFYKSFGIDI